MVDMFDARYSTGQSKRNESPDLSQGRVIVSRVNRSKEDAVHIVMNFQDRREKANFKTTEYFYEIYQGFFEYSIVFGCFNQYHHTI